HITNAVQSSNHVSCILSIYTHKEMPNSTIKRYIPAFHVSMPFELVEKHIRNTKQQCISSTITTNNSEEDKKYTFLINQLFNSVHLCIFYNIQVQRFHVVYAMNPPLSMVRFKEVPFYVKIRIYKYNLLRNQQVVYIRISLYIHVFLLKFILGRFTAMALWMLASQFEFGIYCSYKQKPIQTYMTVWTLFQN
ncbi:hypothetical protein L9F63_007839, partial [Diploptera punctata]